MQHSPPEPRQRPGLRAPLQPRQRGPRALTLDDLGSLYCKIRVDYTRGGPVEAQLSACPDPHEPLAPGFNGAPQDPVVASIVLQSPAHADDHQVHELLTWFLSAAEAGAGDDHAALALPTSCTKGQRAVWHSAAQRVGLHSESMGFGDGRYLQIYSHAAWCRVRAATAGAHAQGQVQTQAEARRGRGGDRELGARAKQLWRWCQAEGLFNYSQGELQQLLTGGAQLPPDVAAVVAKRDVAARLVAALNAADEAAALAAVGEDPTACWVRDDATGGYPAHVAAFFGLERALRAMVAANAPTLLEQRDARRMTPLGVAREAGRAGTAAAIADIMQEAGLGAASPGPGEDRGRSRGTVAPGRSSRPAGTGGGRGRGQQDGQAQGAADAAADCARPPRSAVASAPSPEPLASRPPTAAPGSPPTPQPQPLLPTAGERGFTRQRTASPRVAGVLAAASTAVLTKPPPPPEEPVPGVTKGGKALAVMVRLEMQPNNAARPVGLVLQVVQPGSRDGKESGVRVAARLIVSEALLGHPRPVRLVIHVLASTKKGGRGPGCQDLAHDGRSSAGARGLREPLQGGTQAQGRGQRQAQQPRQSGQQQQRQQQLLLQQQQQQQQEHPQQHQAFEQQQQQQYAWAMYQQQMQLVGMGGGQAMAAAGGVNAPTPLQRAARPDQGLQQFTYANPNNQRQVDQAQYMQQQQQQQQLYQLYLHQQQFYVQHQAVYAQQQQQQQQQHAGQPLYTYQQPRSHQQKAQGHSRRKHANGDGGRQ